MKPLIVVMGVSGAGKSVVGAAIAAQLGLDYADGDAFHAPENVAKMQAGIPLTDRDRAPWLAAIGGWLAAHDRSGGVVSCSALRRSYRDALRAAAARSFFVQLNVDPALLQARMEARRQHFMPATLLSSQLQTLEPLAADEPGVILENQAATPEQLAARFVARLS